VESVPVETDLDLAGIRNTLPVWREMLASAKESIDIETFYFAAMEGEPLDVILREIEDAGKRGVRVRIISEQKFYETYPEPLNTLASWEHIQVRIFDFSRISGGVMHAKYFIIDGRQVFIGSQNFDWRSFEHIHELGIRIEDSPAAAFFSDLFERDWLVAESHKTSPEAWQPADVAGRLSVECGDRLVDITPVYSPIGCIPDSSLWEETHIVALLDSAEESICIQLLNYSPAGYGEYYGVLDNALRRAAARRVKVKMLCSNWAIRFPVIDYLKSLTAVPGITVKLSTIPEYSGGFIPYARVEHAKYLVVDGREFWIGTANWSKGYFYESRNVGLVVRDEQLAGQVQAYFDNTWDSEYNEVIDLGRKYEPPQIGEN
jgi:phosphatidylserine/phosphatidylglycerophosphate/cardiolipin synthase-like enzyme